MSIYTQCVEHTLVTQSKSSIKVSKDSVLHLQIIIILHREWEACQSKCTFRILFQIVGLVVVWKMDYDGGGKLKG